MYLNIFKSQERKQLHIQKYFKEVHYIYSAKYKRNSYFYFLKQFKIIEKCLVWKINLKKQAWLNCEMYSELNVFDIIRPKI